MTDVAGAKISPEPLSKFRGPRLSTRHACLVVSIVLAWSAIQFCFARPESIVDDWNGWRQAETQTLARNFLRPHSNIFFPQINWGGDGPGYVEAEFQLYTYLVSLLLPFSSNQDLPGQVLNILFMSISALLIYYSLRQRYSFPSALCGCAAYLSGNIAVHLSTAIQPDALCFMLYVMGFSLFMKYLSSQRIVYLFLAALSTAIAGPIKPPALNLLITQFILILVLKRDLILSPKIWLCWLLPVVVTGILYGVFIQSLFRLWQHFWYCGR